MLHPASFEVKIGFDLIREHLRQNCLCTAGLNYIDKISFNTDLIELKNILARTEEMRQILLMEQGFPASEYIDLSELLHRIRPEGASILEEELPDVKTSLRTLGEIAFFFNEERIIKYPRLSSLGLGLFNISGPLRRLDQLIDERGRIRDKASPELYRIRHEILRLQTLSREKLAALIGTSRRAGWTPPDLDITLRNGRLVIPLYASHKRKIKGFVHDASATEQTVFLEPEEVLDINNEVKELEALEKEEVRRILVAFSSELRPSIPELLQSYQVLGEFDGIRSKALFALEIGAVMPIVSAGSFIQWFDARHPLLQLNFKRSGKKVVPFSLALNPERRILIISGPNAGGKSVCLKSIGLLQYMVQCGLLVPVRETSETGIFDKIFIDIGDEQSLENDLSTYSSHLMNMNFFLANSDAATLFLIDEFGSGTEPQAGGALAETCLEILHDSKALGAVTTHYANLKILAERLPGIFNGAMMFDTKVMKPLYELLTGRPGTSFAFEIASKIGLPESLIQSAIAKAGHSQYDFEVQVQQLEQERRDLQRRETEFHVADSFLAEMIEKYEKLNQSLENKKHEILRKAKEEAGRIILESNSLIEKTIREIRESQASKDTVRTLRQNIENRKAELGLESMEFITSVEPEEPGRKQKSKEKPVKVIEGPVEEGDHVRLKGQKAVLKVLRITGKYAEVAGGSISMRTEIQNLEKVLIDSDAAGNQLSPSMKRVSDELRHRLETFTPFIDIRGMRAEETRARLELFIDEAFLLNIRELRVLHGKGDGVLRQITRDYLSSRNESIKFRDEHADRGGHGITLITLNA